MLATYASALLLILASLFVGRAFFAILGRRETLWLETPVGLAILIVVCSVLTRISFGAENEGSLPERSELALIACAVLVVGSIAYLRFGFADRESFLMGAPAATLALLAASLPFVASGHIGIPGIGVNNDMAAHLIFADWLQSPTGEAPNGIKIGYPIGPHGLVATISDGLGTEPFYAFLGLLLAIPALTALTALNVLGGVPPVPRALAAALVGLPYLAASTFGIAGFKELLVGLFLLAFALILRTIPRVREGRLALFAALGVLCAGIVASYSYPGLAWPAAIAGVWAVAELWLARREGRLPEVRAELRRALPLLGVAAGAAILVAIAELPRIKDFADSGVVDFVQDTDSKLRFAVSPFEALGAWPSAEWLLSTEDLEAWPLFGAVGLVALGVALVWWVRNGEVTLPAAVGGVALIYLGTLATAGRYVEAKALSVPAALIMLTVLGGLLLRVVPGEEPEAAPGADPEAERRARRAREPRGIGRRALIAIPFVVLASYSSFLALRDAVIAPDDRFTELREFREEVEGKFVLALTSDRYTDYYLRGAEVRSPAINAEQRVEGRPGKRQRLPVDFDSVYARDLDLFDYVVTTDADYQSGAHPNFEEVDRTDSYVLWRRNGVTPFYGLLAEETRPGRVFRCENPKFARILSRTGIAVTWPRPVIAKRLYWEPVIKAPSPHRDPDGDITAIEPGQSVSQTVVLPPGSWDLSFQYGSEVASLEVTAGDLVAEMPPGVEGAVPFRPDQGPYWPVGEVQSDGGPVEITVRAKELSRIQRLLGTDAPAFIGNIAATRLDDIETQRFQRSCGAYLDHYYLGSAGALEATREGGGGTLPLTPTR